MARRGRKVKTDDEEFVNTVCSMIALGETDAGVIKAMGIHGSSFYLWMNTKPVFRDRVTEARMSRRHVLLGRVNEASKKQWQAAVKLLEWYYPEEFANRSKIEMSGPAGGPIHAQVSQVVAQLTTEELRALIVKESKSQ